MYASLSADRSIRRLTTPGQHSTVPRRSIRLALLALVACCWIACERPQPALELALFAPVQIDDRGATASISAADGIGLDLIVEGWQITADRGSPPGLVMPGRTSRLLFFSHDGATTGVQAVYRQPSQAGVKRRVRYSLNGEPLDSLVLFPGHPGFRLDFPAGSVRRGRNVLDLSIENESGGGKVVPLDLSTLRFLPLADSDVRVSPQLVARDGGGDLWLPAGSSFEAAFQVPAGARIDGRLEANRIAGEISVQLTLTGSDGAEVALFDDQLESGAGVQIDVPLERWAGQLAALRIDVAGPLDGLVRFRDASITGPGVPNAYPFTLLARPQPVPPSERLGRPDVILILLDAARADAFSVYGGRYPTPAVDRLASEGTFFSRALAPASWTGQTIPSVFTGLFPDSIGISSWGDSLGGELPTLASAFSAAGYRTVLWSQHPLYKHRQGLTRGFDQVILARKELRDSLPTAEQLHDGDRPTFTFVHFLPPHAPYDAPAPFAGSLSSWYDGDFDPDPQLLNQFPDKRDSPPLSADDLRYVRDRYQEKVAYADSLVGHVMGELEASGGYEDALIAVLSDHGEGFLEHGSFLHTTEIYTEVVHVPLVVKWPAEVRGFRSEVTETVTLADLMPTLVDGLGLPVAGAGFQGRSLLPAVYGDAPAERAVYAMTSGVHRPGLSPRRKLRLEHRGWSVVYDPQSDRTELYRLADDPAETRNLAPERVALALLLKQEVLMQHLFNRGLLEAIAEGAGSLEPALAKELEALGYL